MREINGDPILVDLMMVNYRHAKLPERERRMLDYVVKLTNTSYACSEADVDALRRDGWSEEDIMDIVEVTAMFAFQNRLANAFGWIPNAEAHGHAR